MCSLQWSHPGMHRRCKEHRRLYIFDVKKKMHSLSTFGGPGPKKRYGLRCIACTTCYTRDVTNRFTRKADPSVSLKWCHTLQCTCGGAIPRYARMQYTGGVKKMQRTKRGCIFFTKGVAKNNSRFAFSVPPGWDVHQRCNHNHRYATVSIHTLRFRCTSPHTASLTYGVGVHVSSAPPLRHPYRFIHFSRFAPLKRWAIPSARFTTAGVRLATHAQYPSARIGPCSSETYRTFHSFALGVVCTAGTKKRHGVSTKGIGLI